MSPLPQARPHAGRHDGSDEEKKEEFCPQSWRLGGQEEHMKGITDPQ